MSGTSRHVVGYLICNIWRNFAAAFSLKTTRFWLRARLAPERLAKTLSNWHFRVGLIEYYNSCPSQNFCISHRFWVNQQRSWIPMQKWRRASQKELNGAPQDHQTCSVVKTWILFLLTPSDSFHLGRLLLCLHRPSQTTTGIEPRPSVSMRKWTVKLPSRRPKLVQQT